MLYKRIIPCLQLLDNALVKTTQFNNYKYIGDPINTVKIFNELEVDELCLIDIRATLNKHIPNYKILSEIANECFMPLSYGGGIKNSDEAKKILSIGFEKIILNSSVFENPNLITEIAKHSGSQSVIVAIDIKRNFWGNLKVYSNSGTKRENTSPIEWSKFVEELGAGEILLTSIDREGTWKGFDIDLINQICDNTSVPVIANGGAGCINDISIVLNQSKASAVAVGSMVVYQQKDMGVLVNFPDKNVLKENIEKYI